MILVHKIGMLGYVPLEGVAGLSHALLYCSSGKCECRYGFSYLGTNEISKTKSLDILRRVVSFSFVRRFDDSVVSIISRDVGLLSGYHCAGVVFPNRLRDAFRDLLGLSEYHSLSRPPIRSGHFSFDFVFTSAWFEYICLEFVDSSEFGPNIFITALWCKNPVPNFIPDGLSRVLGR